MPTPMLPAPKLSALTGGEDGLNFRLPQLLLPGTQLLETPLLGVDINGRIVSYYLVFCTALALLPQASVAVQVRAMTLVPPQLLVTASL